MIKILLSALVLGLVAARKEMVLAYTNEHNPRTIYNLPGIVDLIYDYYMDFFTGFYYEPGTVNDHLAYEQIGF
jgi:hypothetical protein